MRLIDADKVNDHIVGWVDLRDCPTIEAIPIEWIIKKLNEADNIGFGIEDWSEQDCYRLVLTRWREENEETEL